MAIIQWCIRNECVCDRVLYSSPPLYNVRCICSGKCIWKARKLFGYVRQEQNNNLAIVCQQSWGNRFVEKCVFSPFTSFNGNAVDSACAGKSESFPISQLNEYMNIFTTPCLSVTSALVPWTLVLSFYELLMDSRFPWRILLAFTLSPCSNDFEVKEGFQQKIAENRCKAQSKRKTGLK